MKGREPIRKFLRILKFQLVAWVGTAVNLGALWFLKGRLGVPIVVAGACAIELAIIHNFTWHYFVTWHDRVDFTVRDYFARLLRYNVVTASIDFAFNLGILWLLTTQYGVHYLMADAIGMLAGPVLKFIVNEFLIFRGEKEGENHEDFDEVPGIEPPIPISREPRPDEKELPSLIQKDGSTRPLEL